MSAQAVTPDQLAAIPLPDLFGDAFIGLDKVALALTDLREAVAVVDPEPTDAQKEYGNYQKGHVSWKGLGLTIESAIGQYRRGVTKAGDKWETLMKDHYGYIKRTESEADGDHIDIFLCEDDLDSDIVFVINQHVGGKFDEHKCVLGATNEAKAREVYTRNYQSGWDGLHSVCQMTVPQFKWWIEHGDTSKEIEGMMFAKHRREKKAHDLWEYDCPKCGGTAYNGDPETGDRYRGSGKCADCGHSFSIVGAKLLPREKKAFDEYEADLIEKRAKLLPGVQLRPHQQEVAATGEEPESRQLLYHSLGSGKSLSSLAAAETAGDPYTAITPASLRPNYRKEQEKFTDMQTPSTLASYNSVAAGTVAPTDTLLFDEAQRLRNPESATTQQATALADQAKHLYLLSGTPVVNHPRDLAPMIRMLTGKSFSPEQFDAKFIDERKISPGLMGWLRGVRPVKVPQMKNKEEFEQLMKGHVHYYAPEQPDVEKKEEHVVTDMGPEQIKLYKAFWNQLPWIYRWKLQNSYPLTRQEMSRMSGFLSGPRQVGLSTYPFMRGKGDPLRAYDQSPKLQRAVGEMTKELESDPNARGVAFSNFIDAGLSPYGAALAKAKIPYGVFHGGLNDGDRKKVVDDYNNNRIRALLLGPSGGEGISLKGTRLLQILDPHWNSARTNQAVGRGIRYDSHSDLPIQDRNIRVQRYISQLPPTGWQRAWRSVFGSKQNEDARRTTPGADTYLEQLAARKDGLNEQFLEELRRIGSMDKQSADEAATALAEKMQDAERVFTVAVDLDGTLAETLTPHDPETIGPLRPKAKEWMEKFQAAGARIIIFTVRGDDELVGDWLDENEIPYDYINENPDQPPDSSGKIIADLYLDDRAVDASGDWDDHGDLVLQRVKSAFSVGTANEDVLDLFVSELVDARRTFGCPAAVAV